MENPTKDNPKVPEIQEPEVEILPQTGSTYQPRPRVVIVRHEKSMILGLILTFFFGSLGMLYSTITGGIVMFFMSIFIAFITLGFGLIIIWPIQLVWTAIAISNYNSTIRRQTHY